MMLQQLNVQNIRCLKELSLGFSSPFTLFYGENGSGKSSILESIHILSTGRSFRASAIESVISYGEDFLSVYGEITRDSLPHRLGILKRNSQKTEIHIDFNKADTIAALASMLPLQVIHPDSEVLLTGPPKYRRQFISWGVFHVEHEFFQNWKQFNHLLKQRNALLKQKASFKILSSWDAFYISLCELLSSQRKAYIDALKPIFKEIMDAFLRLPGVEISYQPGWPQDKALQYCLEKSYLRDIGVGYTRYGVHKDELLVKVNNYLASEVLSRGEQKLVMMGLKLAQGYFLHQANQKQCVYLLDDFGAELDEGHKKELIKRLLHMKAQVFFTTIDYKEVKHLFSMKDLNVFHVEHGHLETV